MIALQTRVPILKVELQSANELRPCFIPKTTVQPQLAGHSLSAASICGNDSYRPLGELRSS
jgi:hypothetical protein